MKDMTMAQKMRWIAGGMYMLLAVYQLFTCLFLMENGSLGGLPVVYIFSILLSPLAAGFAVWLFSSRRVLSGAVRRGTVAATVFCVLFELFTYDLQTQAVSLTLQGVLNTESAHDNSVVLYVLVIIRLLLLILAAFFVTSSRKSLDLDVEEAVNDNSALLEEELAIGNAGAEEVLELVEAQEEQIIIEVEAEESTDSAE